MSTAPANVAMMPALAPENETPPQKEREVEERAEISAIELSEELAPTRFRLPQDCSPDRQRSREAILKFQRTRFVFVSDTLPGHPTPGFQLPRYLDSLPPEQQFSAPKIASFLGAKLAGKLNYYIAYWTAPRPPFKDPVRYKSLLRYLPRPPAALDQWADPNHFAQLRLTGVNPFELRLCREEPSGELAAVAADVLRLSNWTLRDALLAQRLFLCDYPAIGNEHVQNDALSRGVHMLLPTCLFWDHPENGLMPVAIELREPVAAEGASKPLSRVFSALDSDRARWAYAVFHAQSAHVAYHQGVRHLLSTHLVCEAIAVAMHRTLHVDHPLHQLLLPHFKFTLAINSLARRDLLGAGGAIDVALGAGVPGALDAARVAWQAFDFRQADPISDLKDRGLFDQSVLANRYLYRDDALRVWAAIEDYVRRVLKLWYEAPGAIRDDIELRSWAAEVSGAGVSGFPQTFTLDTLCKTVASIIYRASAMHAAVNNGQYDNYGFIPNSPAHYEGPRLSQFLAEVGVPEEEIWKGLPNFKQSMNQCTMGWVLSDPTLNDLFSAGESPAFTQVRNPFARDAVARFRRALSGISSSIKRRNEGLKEARKAPYVFLDPEGIACSVET